MDECYSEIYYEKDLPNRGYTYIKDVHRKAGRSSKKDCESSGTNRMEQKQKKVKRQCQILGTVAIILLGAVTASAVRKNQSAGRASGRRVTIQDNRRAASIKTTDDLLVLVNKTHALPTGYDVELHWLENGSCAVAEEMYEALRMMLTDGSTQGREFVVASGYRSSEYQQQLLDEDIEASMLSEGLTWEQAYEKETRETMPPGYSEHETGLAVDIVALEYQILDREQENTPENIWLRENCSQYGFIVRYPKGSEDITQINYEPWHFRYVGYEAAEEIMGRGITLEEFLNEA